MNKGEFEQTVRTQTSLPDYVTPFAFGVGIARRSLSGTILEVYYHSPQYQAGEEVAAVLASVVGHRLGNRSHTLSVEAMKRALTIFEGSPAANTETALLLKRLCYSPVADSVVVTFLSEDKDPESTEEVYLKLSLLSHRLVEPHGVNLEGLFKVLPNVAWTSEGPIAVDELAERQLSARLEGKVLEVFSVDKFPKMVNYIVPSQVRIADAARVRLGAYLGAGTTVMQAGFVNFNAGTAGPNMVEGRISAGVFVDSGSDLGGACSTLGTLSGGNSTRVRIGKNCLIGANAGAGISLGDNSTIEAGLFVTGGSKVELLDHTGKKIGLVKAKELSDRPNLLFRRNSATGRIEAIEGKFAVQLNEVLHVNR